MSPLSNDLRNILERAIIKAREIAEEAAIVALKTLAVANDEPFTYMNTEQRRLRNALRAKARQLGNGDFTKGWQPLIEEVAYEQWHNRLFARFLAENDLLIHPEEKVAVTLDECAELATEMEAVDAWQLATRYASDMLPGIFRVEDPVMQMQLAPEGRHKLEYLINELPLHLFTTDDALGWVYQFWQTKKKAEVNKSKRKISASDISPITQLFTEHYMVQFLLDNSLGAWWAARHPTSPLIKQFTYLRFTDSGIPVVGTFPGWPNQVSKVTVMDPCCGSGHFLVAAFNILYQMRMEEEGLSEVEASDAVLRDNLFGLELDARCTQIAAFSLALAVWKIGGYHQIPLPNIACSGIAIEGQLEIWTRMSGNDNNLCFTLEHYYHLFQKAPHLGSLINPNDVPLQSRMFQEDYTTVEPLLSQVLAKERTKNDPTSTVFGESATGVAKAVKLLADRYTLVVTNVPYLKREKHSEILKKYCDQNHPDALADLSTAFIERCRAFAQPDGGTYALVTPQNWHFLSSFSNLRKRLIIEQTWNMIVNLGSKAFQTPMWDFNVALSILTNSHPDSEQTIAGIDASVPKIIQEKAKLLISAPLQFIKQVTQLKNPDTRIVLTESFTTALLEQLAYSCKGITTGDDLRFRRRFWEMPSILPSWQYLQSTLNPTEYFGGRESVIWLDALRDPQHTGSYIRGTRAWGKKGVLVSLMGHLPVTLYTGEAFDTNCAPIIPENEEHLPALWAFCKSLEFNKEVRRINQALKVADSAIVKVPFDLEYWQKVASEAGHLPEPHSNDPTQWLFNGNPVDTIEPLQASIARLLDYNWPQHKHDVLDTYNDKGHIICLPSVAGENTAVERLRSLLSVTYGDAWSATLQDQLLQNAEFGGKSLEAWLRDGFFAQHCRLFHNRPFIWHIWDGRKDGFSALVNYHHLDAVGLDHLIYTYLGSWISTQRDERDAGVVGADARLVAALELQKKLEAIRDGEPPYDIYVRWKPFHEQPLGWEPDLNDGVRLNIRPFVEAGVLRSRFTINWNKDRGTNPDGSERFNDLHYTLAQKYEARAVLQ